MIVCVCHGVGCGAVRAAIRAGATTVDAVGEACGAGTDCGSCREEIASLLEEGAESGQPAPSRHHHLRLAPASYG